MIQKTLDYFCLNQWNIIVIQPYTLPEQWNTKINILVEEAFISTYKAGVGQKSDRNWEAKSDQQRLYHSSTS